jgi:preprotein translocase subunit SecG
VIYLVYTIHVITCLFLILVVLLQQGKGADLSVFGGGSTQAAFGARGAATFLHKMTVIGFVAFIFTTMSIGFLQSSGRQGSVMTAVEEEQTEPATETEAVPEPETTPAQAPEGETAPAGEPVGEEINEPSMDESAEPPTG